MDATENGKNSVVEKSEATPSEDSALSVKESESKLLVIEPFYCGSHKQLVDLLVSSYDSSSVQLVTMPGKKWPWRARTSALWLSTAIPPIGLTVKTLFSSSVLNLAELVGLRPDIRSVPLKILYFQKPTRLSGAQK